MGRGGGRGKAEMQGLVVPASSVFQPVVYTLLVVHTALSDGM
jgi:hypothetical protein